MKISLFRILVSALLLGCFLLASSFLTAQPSTSESIHQRVIHLEASAMREVVPDEYYFQVHLKEYTQGKIKVAIETLEDRMIKGLDSIGISQDQISLERMSDLQTYKRRRSKTHLTGQVYQIKLSKLDKLQAMFEVLSKVPAVSASLSHVDHSKMTEFRRDVKVEAMKAGKGKADYLLEAIGSKTGKLLHVREMDRMIPINPRQPNLAMNSNTVNFNYNYQWDKAKQESITYKTITIRYAFELKFEIME